MRVYLVGYMASGKSWLGNELAQATGMRFVDLDELFEKKFRITILDFFDKYGEPLFRQLEQEVLLETLSTDHAVIATGGGTPCFFRNMDFILESGLSIYLRMEVPELLSRIKGIRKKRPLLRKVEVSRLGEYVRDQLVLREPFYRRADLTFNGPDYPVEEIAGIVKGYEGRKV